MKIGLQSISLWTMLRGNYRYVAYSSTEDDWRQNLLACDSLHKGLNLVGAFKHFFIFHNIWDNLSHWLICFRGVETTNQELIGIACEFVCTIPLLCDFADEYPVRTSNIFQASTRKTLRNQPVASIGQLVDPGTYFAIQYRIILGGAVRRAIYIMFF